MTMQVDSLNQTLRSVESLSHRVEVDENLVARLKDSLATTNQLIAETVAETDSFIRARAAAERADPRAQAVASVCAMGFAEDQAREALELSNGNVEFAIEFLLAAQQAEGVGEANDQDEQDDSASVDSQQE